MKPGDVCAYTIIKQRQQLWIHLNYNYTVYNFLVVFCVSRFAFLKVYRVRIRLHVNHADCIKETLPSVEKRSLCRKETLCSLALKSSAGASFGNKATAACVRVLYAYVNGCCKGWWIVDVPSTLWDGSVLSDETRRERRGNCVHAARCTTKAAGTPLYRTQTMKGEKTEKKNERKTIKWRLCCCFQT